MTKLIDSKDEQNRLDALFKYKILDTPQEKEFDEITKLASYICQTPIALISLIDDSRQWFKSRVGLDVSETPREISFCQHAIKSADLFEINNALEDDRFKNNPLVTGSPEIRFYAGTPLNSASGYNIGTLCVIDTVPRNLSVEQKESLETLGKQIITELELREKNCELQVEIEKLAARNFEKREIQKALVLKNEELEKANKEITAGDMFFSLSLDLLFVATSEKFVKVNPSFMAVLGYEEKFLLETPFMSFLHPDDIPAALNELVKIQQGIPTVHFEARYRCKDGTYRWMDWGVSPDIKTDLRYGFAHDITEFKKNEEELTQAKELAEKLVGVKDRFLANMSHEIRTPLNAVIGFTDLLTQTNLDGVQKEYINSVQVAGENLLLILNDILDLSKIESGNLLIDKQPFNLQKTLKHVYALLKGKVAKGVEFNLFLDANLPKIVVGDQGRLNQILVNLVGNALKFTERGEVNVSVKMLDQSSTQCSLKFSIKDSGIGIPKDQLDAIFDRFTQAEEGTTRRFGGTGLGLSIVKQLVELHDSEIFVSSEHNEGSEFYFVFTYQKSYQKENFSNDEQQEILGCIKILLCEDNILNQKLASSVIHSFGFDLDMAENGDEGIDLLRKNSYDLILMDLQMPVKDGYQTTEYIRNEMKSNIPIIAMSAHSLVGEQERCYNVGMNGFVPKPFKQAELLKAIKTALSDSGTFARTRNIDFSLLEEMSCGDENFKKEMIALFIKKIPIEVSHLQHSINENDYKEVNKIAHKLQSSLDIFMLHDITNYLHNIVGEAVKKEFTAQTFTNIKNIQSEVNVIINSLRLFSISS